MTAPAATVQALEQMPVTHLKGVGPNLAERLANLGITTVLDLLFHLPLRYQDRTRLTPIGALRPGHDVVIEGLVAGWAADRAKVTACCCITTRFRKRPNSAWASCAKATTAFISQKKISPFAARVKSWARARPG